jgi:5-methylcytosine-specific restriction protein A
LDLLFYFSVLYRLIYNEKCAISATNLPPVLEAAHIVPYQGVETNHITNGILLRSDFQ